MRPGKSWMTALAGLTALAVFAAACGAETPPPGSGGNSPSGGSSTSPTVQGGGPSTPTGEFRVSISGEPPTIDPNTSNFAQSISVVRQLFSGLFEFSPAGELVPDAAKEVPSASNGGISADGKTFTFKLKDGLKWSDGKPVVAEDFAYSLRRMLNPKLGAEYASFFHDIKGAEAYNTALGTKEAPKQVDDATLAKMEAELGIKATDNTTLVVELARPRATFLQIMGLHTTAPLRKDVIEQHGDKWIEAGNLIGNGPYVLSEWAHNDRLVLTPNPNYHGEPAKIAKVTLLVGADANANYAAYKTGERELVSVPLTLYRQVLNDPSVKDEILRYAELTTFAYQMNNRRAPFDNVKVRQAFARAINRTAFVDRVQNGVGKPATSWLPPGMPGHDPEAGKVSQGYDPAAAKKLLADAGYPDGQGLPQVTMQYANAGSNQQLAEFLQGQLKDNLGVEIKLEPMETAVYSRAINNNEFHIAFLGWGADYPDPDNWLPENFGSKGSNNHTGYSNPRFDETVQKAMGEPDEKTRIALWMDAQRIMTDDAPVIFLFHRERLWLKKTYVKDLITTGMDSAIPGSQHLNKTWVDK